MSQGLPVRLLLRSSGVDLDPLCPLCRQQNESIELLFLSCPSTIRVWEAVEDHNWIPSGFLRGTNPDIGTLLLNWQLQSSKSTKQRTSFLLWYIRKARNGVIFNNEAINPLSCLIKAKREGTEWRARTRMPANSFPGGTPSFPHHKSYFIVRWLAPPPSVMKLNFDGSCRGSAAAGGFILGDWRSQLLQLGSYNYGNATIMVVEARAMHDSILHTLRMGYRHIIIEGDNSMVIHAILSSSGVP